MWSFDDIFLFAKVVEVGSFLHTSKLLKINQSTISRRIRDLEQTLGVVLIRRNTKHFEITDVGQSIYDLCKGKDSDLREKIHKLTNTTNTVNGIIRASIPPSLGERLIVPHLTKFMQQYPDLTLHLCFQNKELDLIKDGIDVAIVSYIPKQQTQKIKLIATADVALVCTLEYATKYGVPTTVDELEQHNVLGVMLEDYSVPEQFSITNVATNQESMFKVSNRLAVNTVNVCKEMLYDNEMIIGGLDIIFKDELESKKLIRILPEYKVGGVKFYQIKHPHETSYKLEVFCKFLQDCCSGGYNTQA